MEQRAVNRQHAQSKAAASARERLIADAVKRWFVEPGTPVTAVTITEFMQQNGVPLRARNSFIAAAGLEAERKGSRVMGYIQK